MFTAKSLFSAVALSVSLAVSGSAMPGEFGNEPGFASGPALAAAVQAPMVERARANSPTFRGASGQNIVIPRSADGLFYIDAVVGDATVRFLVDTGANVTVLTMEDAQKLNLSSIASRRGSSLQTVGGMASTSWARIPRLDIGNMPISDVEAAVIERGLPVSLLGQNVLSRLDGLTFTGDKLHIH